MRPIQKLRFLLRFFKRVKDQADVTHILITEIKVGGNGQINIALIILNMCQTDKNGKVAFFSAENKSIGHSCGFLQMSSWRFLQF